MLQQTPKKDKKARAELEERIKKMEADMKKRHETELKDFDAKVWREWRELRIENGENREWRGRERER